MKLRFAMLLAGLASRSCRSACLSPVGSASAEEPGISGEIDAAYFFGNDAGMPSWLRYSIVYCAAKTMNLEVDQVSWVCVTGSSLTEIGIRAGVRPDALATGILRCEHNLLDRLVNSGDLDPGAGSPDHDLPAPHIERIINYSWDGESSGQ